MGILDQISENIYLTTLIVVISLLITEYFFYTKQLHYNLSKDKKMKEHYLNRKFQLNKKKNINVEKINRTIALTNVIAIVIGGALMAFVNITAGVLTYMGLSFFLNLYVMNDIGKKYTKQITSNKKI